MPYFGRTPSATVNSIQTLSKFWFFPLIKERERNKKMILQQSLPSRSFTKCCGKLDFWAKTFIRGWNYNLGERILGQKSGWAPHAQKKLFTFGETLCFCSFWAIPLFPRSGVAIAVYCLRCSTPLSISVRRSWKAYFYRMKTILSYQDHR